MQRCMLWIIVDRHQAGQPGERESAGPLAHERAGQRDHPASGPARRPSSLMTQQARERLGQPDVTASCWQAGWGSRCPLGWAAAGSHSLSDQSLTLWGQPSYLIAHVCMNLRNDTQHNTTPSQAVLAWLVVGVVVRIVNTTDVGGDVATEPALLLTPGALKGRRAGSS